MEVLSAAAAAAPPAPGAIPGAAAAPELPQVELPGAAPPPARKPKRTRRQIAQDSVAEATQKIAGFTAAKASSLAAAAVSTATSIKQRHESKAQSHTDNIRNWEEKLKERQEKLKELEEAAFLAEQVAAAKQARSRAQAEETQRPMSDEGIRLLVRTRLSMQNQFDNKTDKNDNVWEHVKAKMDALINKGEALGSDCRPLASLKSKFSREMGQFKLYSNKCHRAAASGASRDAIGSHAPA